MAAGVGTFNRGRARKVRRPISGAVLVTASLVAGFAFTARTEHAQAALIAPWENPTIADTNYTIPSGAIYVSNHGSDSNSGSSSKPLATIVKAITRAHAGSTIVVRGGTYRETLGTVGIGVTIQAYPHEKVWIKGSRVVTNFTTSGSRWTRPWKTALCSSCYPGGVLDSNYPNAGRSDQVFFDGRPLAQASSLAGVNAATFYMDRTNGRLYLGRNPSGHYVEVTVYDKAVLFNSHAVGAKLKGLGFAHYGSHYNYDVPAMVIGNADSLVFDHNTFAWSATRGLSFFGNRNVVAYNSFLNNGMNGVHSFDTHGTNFTHNRLAFNNFERFSYAMSSSGSVAAAKMTVAEGGTYSYNVFADNASNGLWLDVSSSNNAVVNNAFVRNAGNGFDVEISANTIVAGNVMAGNGWDGLKISGANNVEVWNNTIYGNHWSQLGIYEDPRKNPPSSIAKLGITWNTSNVRVFNNVIVSGPYSSKPILNSFDLTSPKHATTTMMISSQDNNIWGRSTYTGLKYLGYVQATLSKTAWYSDLKAMQTATHRESKSRSADNVSLSRIFVNAGAGDFRLASTAPKPAPATLASKAAIAMGVTATVPTIGALKAPHG